MRFKNKILTLYQKKNNQIKNNFLRIYFLPVFFPQCAKLLEKLEINFSNKLYLYSLNFYYYKGIFVLYKKINNKGAKIYEKGL